MDFKKLTQDVVTGNWADLGGRISKAVRLAKRFMHLRFRENINDPITAMPVVINNRNRYSYLMLLVQWLEARGFKNIIILDNSSSYPPLLEWYERSSFKIIHLGANLGPRAIWQCAEVKNVMKDYYIYTDADVVPEEACTLETISRMKAALRKNPTLEKVGLGLRIDDLPDHFKLKSEVIEWESQFWKNPVDEEFYVAAVDTTFALYAPYAEGGGECKAWRTGLPTVARHMPWYENSNQQEEENLFYIRNAAPLASHWTDRTKQ